MLHHDTLRLLLEVHPGPLPQAFSVRFAHCRGQNATGTRRWELWTRATSPSRITLEIIVDGERIRHSWCGRPNRQLIVTSPFGPADQVPCTLHS